MMLNPQSLICNGGYRLIAKAGAGGFGSVWKARNVFLDKIVALKFLDQNTPFEIRELLQDEGRKLARVSGHGALSRHVVYVNHFFVGDAETPPFLELEWVSGGNLAQRLVKMRPLSVEQMLALAVDVASGLHYAHSLGLIHCDLKPSNILFSDDERIYKLTDFGLARSLGIRAGRSLQGGTLPYMSPEQFHPDTELTRLSDVYGFGCVLFEVCEGRPPFGEAGWDINQYQEAHTAQPVPGLTASGLPADFTALIHACLAKNTGDRPSMEEVRRRLRRLLAAGGPALQAAESAGAGGPALRQTAPQCYLHPGCDLELRLVAAGDGVQERVLLPTRLPTNRDFLLFLREPANRSWQPSLVAPEHMDGGYLVDWNGDLPPIGQGNQPVAGLSYSAALAFARWLGGRLPRVKELQALFASPEATDLVTQIRAYCGQERLSFLQFWCEDETAEDDATAPLVRFPNTETGIPGLAVARRPRHFSFPHYAACPVLAAALAANARPERAPVAGVTTGEGVVPLSEIAEEMEQFIGSYLRGVGQ